MFSNRSKTSKAFRNNVALWTRDIYAMHPDVRLCRLLCIHGAYIQISLVAYILHSNYKCKLYLCCIA